MPELTHEVARAQVETLGRALGLPLDACDVDEIARHYGIALRLADAILDFPLPDATDPAPVFDPLDLRP